MAEVEEPQFTTLAERIAALNQQKNFKAPPPTPAKRAPPPPPPTAPASARTATDSRSTAAVASNVNVPAEKSPPMPPRPSRAVTEDSAKASPPLPRRNTEQVQVTTGKRAMAQAPPVPSRGAAPPLPSRNSHKQMTPAPELPSRRPSAQTLPVRRDSNSSDVSHVSAMSSLSLTGTSDTRAGSGTGTGTRRLPPTLDQAKLPPLPPSRRELEAAKKAFEEEQGDARSPALPPRLPTRPAKSPTVAEPEERSPALPARRLPPPPSSYRPSGLGLNSGRDSSGGAPPPLPLSSRPTMAQIDAVASRGAAASRPAPSTPSNPSNPSKEDCLICRDFSGPDNLAALFPVANLPRQDVVGYLAHVLCDPFPSSTDKARAIFTWCHHNIAYDCEAFFGNRVRGITPEEGIFEGKAVCSGYAGVYEAIARRAGLECIVITGHGKGYGHKALAPGEPTPPRKADNHAWNAVRIDGGRWKVIDACWGAGNVADQRFTKAFKPSEFVLSNIQIGMRHYPENSAHFFREDGRIPSWEEYIIGDSRDGERATWYTKAGEEGLSEYGFTPRARHIPVRGGGVVQFRLSKVCEHWTYETHGKGKPLLLALKIHGLDGRNEDLVPLDYDGFWFSIDVPARDLGTPGQTISLYGFDTIDGRDARGLTKEEWLRKKGKVGYSLVGVAQWELV